jgi:hypothetical protein
VLSVALLCGWVLWGGSRIYMGGNRVVSSIWGIEDAFESKKECVDAFREHVSVGEEVAKERGAKTSSGRDHFNEYGDGGLRLRSVRFWCLPGGADPRPRFKE